MRLVRRLEYAVVEVLLWACATPCVPSWARPRVLRGLGIDIAGTVVVESGARLVGRHMVIGDSAYLNTGCLVEAKGAAVVIGERVELGPDVRLLTSSHELGPSDARAGSPTCDEVVVGSGSWLGAGCTVLPGVKIGAGCVIAAGAVVTEDCAAHGLYAGVPARRVRDLVEAPGQGG